MIEFAQNLVVASLNFIVGKAIKLLDENFEPIKLQVVEPRKSDNIWTRPFSERPRTPWTFPISIYKDYKIDTEAVLRECFEFDWSQMRFPKMSEETMEKVKTALWTGYKYIKDTYRY